MFHVNINIFILVDESRISGDEWVKSIDYSQ